MNRIIPRQLTHLISNSYNDVTVTIYSIKVVLIPLEFHIDFIIVTAISFKTMVTESSVKN